MEGGPPGFHWDEACYPEDDGLPGDVHGGCKCASGACSRETCPCYSAALSEDAEGRLVSRRGSI